MITSEVDARIASKSVMEDAPVTVTAPLKLLMPENAATRSPLLPDQSDASEALLRLIAPEVSTLRAFSVASDSASCPDTVMFAVDIVSWSMLPTSTLSSALEPLTVVALVNTTAPVVLPATALKSPTATAPVSVKFTE